MSRTLLLFFFLFASAWVFAQPSDSYLQSQMASGTMPGAGFVIIKDGKWVFNRSLGKSNIATNANVTRESIFMMASVSKTMIATAAMQLWERGLLDLDRDINHYLPFPVRTPANPSDSITMRMLLTHTSAIRDNWNVMGPLYVYGDSPIPMGDFLEQYIMPAGTYYFISNFYFYPPGTQHNYSNIGSTIAAYVVERITGDKFSHYCDTAIFNKICMDNTSFLLSGIQDTSIIARPYSWNGTGYDDNGLYGYPDYPDGQLRTNITALARFMTMYMNHGIYEGARLLDSTTVAYMMHQQTNTSWYQGIIFYAGVGSNGDTLWGHNGGDAGVNTAMYFNFSKKTGVIVLTNGDGTSLSNADKIADTLYRYGITVVPGVNDTFPTCHMITSSPHIMAATKDLTLYPNPASTSIAVKMPVDGQLRMLNIQGQVIQRFELNTGNNLIVLPEAILSGVYVCQVYDNSGRVVAIKRLVIAR